MKTQEKLSDNYGTHTPWHDPKNELAKVTAQRDELLAALKQAAKLLEPFIRKMNVRNHFSEINAFENTIQKTIAKVEANQ